MARGSIAKTNITEKLKNFFGTDFIGEVDRKLYIWADDGGERVQIAIAMTCPKTNVDFGETGGFIEPGSTVGVVGSYAGKRIETQPIVEMTPEEQENIATLIAKLGL